MYIGGGGGKLKNKCLVPLQQPMNQGPSNFTPFCSNFFWICY